MADWTGIADSFLEPGKPVRSVDGLALRDNPIAIAEGAPGAPRIAGQQGPALRNAGVPNGELGAEKFQSGATERDWVMARVVSAAEGTVGSYGFFRIANPLGTTTFPGNTVSGSNLDWSNTDEPTSSSPPGTWRCHGFVGNDTQAATLFQRIS